MRRLGDEEGRLIANASNVLRNGIFPVFTHTLVAQGLIYQ
jgi:hypothetical protein